MLKILYINTSCILSHSLSEKAQKKREITKRIGDLLIQYGLKNFFGLEAENFTILKNEHGKPYLLPVQDIYYNISHAGDYIVCAFSDREVGIDIEKIKECRIKVAERYFHPCEIKELKKVSGDKQNQLFFQYWTIKESYLKYTGQGISGGLSSFEVKIQNDSIQIYKGNNPLPVKITACPIDTEYLCYVSSENYTNPEIIAVGEEKLIQAEVL